MKFGKSKDGSVIYNCRYHLVFCPAPKRDVLVNGVNTRFMDIAADVCGKLSIDPVSIDVKPGYVHMVIDAGPEVNLDKAVKKIKQDTSNILRREFPELTIGSRTLWTDSYFISTDTDPSRDIEKYLMDQRG